MFGWLKFWKRKLPPLSHERLRDSRLAPRSMVERNALDETRKLTDAHTFLAGGMDNTIEAGSMNFICGGTPRSITTLEDE
jgi:hypothetical protein